MRRKLALLFVLATTVATVTTSAYASGGGNSGAAHACQRVGYLNLHRSDGSSFKDVGACVSYAATGGQFQQIPIPSCTVSSSPPTGCLTFPSETLSGDNNIFPNSGWTLTLNAVFSFDSSQSGNFSSFPNDYATGGGSYVIRNASGTIVEQGTLTANNGSAGTAEGLSTALYLNDSVLIGSCSAANRRDLAVDASTSHGAFMYLSGTGYTGSTPGYTSQSDVRTNSYGSFSLDPSPVTVGC